jgi:mitogen-activated protein kinase organizer 1
MTSSGTAAQQLPRTEARSLSGHEGAVLAVRFNRDGNYCLSCGKDRTLRLWNPHTGAHVKTYKSHAREVRDVHSSSYVRKHAHPLLHLLVSLRCVASDPETRQREIRLVLLAVHSFHGLFLDRDNAKLVSCGADRQIFYWDVASGRVIRKFRGHNSEVMH